MLEAKPTTYLLPSAIRQGIHGVHQRMPQRKLDKVLVVGVVIGALYCLSLSVSSFRPHHYIQNVILGPRTQENPASLQLITDKPDLPSKPTQPWNLGTTMRAEYGSKEPNFRQPKDTVVVVREGSDVQLDCKIARKPHAIVTWYRGKDTFLTMGLRVYSDLERISISVDEDKLNWALRLRDVTLEDADTYSCHLALSANDVVSIVLDVLPRDEGVTPTPAVSPPLMSKSYLQGFKNTPDEGLCPNQGADLTAVIAVTSHPLYGTTRDRVRRTWGSPNVTGNDIAVIYGIGSINDAIYASVKEEIAKNGDVLVGSFNDISIDVNTETYHKLNILQWVVEKCPKVKHALLVTHNQFVNVEKFRQVLSELDPDQKEIHGNCEVDTTTIRDPSDSNYIQYMHYQKPTLPVFCLPPTFLFSGAAVSALYKQALQETLIPKSHVFLTGVSAESAGVKRIHTKSIYKAKQRVESCEYQLFVAGDTWGEVTDKKVILKIIHKYKC